ncbi:MAG: MBL fold metallo-hydrolase [Gammaproteobacteria bacterium]|nr:MBL fold metallo-hydrolase [Gammaproteobacteria bacterium]
MRARRMIFSAVTLILGGYLSFSLWGGEPIYSGAKSDHFDGERFFNLVEKIERRYVSALRGVVSGDQGLGQWDKLPNKHYGPPVERVMGKALRVTFINHSTTLIQTEGLNILTDPIWSDYCGPLPLASPYRYRPPGLRFEELPQIDVVVVSHSHYDHMDIPSLKRLSERFEPQVLVGIGNAELLRKEGIKNVKELDWWDSTQVHPNLEVVGVPAQHWSRRNVGDKNKRLWMGYVFNTPHGAHYFAGDTAMGPHFKMIKERFGGMRLALLPIGAFRPESIMEGSHISPVEALNAHELLGAETSVAIHWGTFRLGMDGQFEAVDVLKTALVQRMHAGEVIDFRVLDFGESLELK